MQYQLFLVPSPSVATTCHSVNEEGVMKADQATGVCTYEHCAHRMQSGSRDSSTCSWLNDCIS